MSLTLKTSFDALDIGFISGADPGFLEREFRCIKKGGGLHC